MDTILVRDNRTNVVSHQSKEHVIFQGASRVTEYIQVSNSYNNNQANWSFQPPSTKIIVDRRFLLRAYVRVTPVGGDFQFGTNDALRQAPLASIMENLDVRLNGGSLADNISDRIHAMLCYNNNAIDRTCNWSTTPIMPDAYQDLNDWTLYGSAKNPLADYGESGVEDPRGGFPSTPTVGMPGSYDFVITEPLFLSPLNAAPSQDDEGFVNVNQIDVKMRWLANLNRIFSHASSGDPLTDVTVSFYQAPELLIRYFTPDQNQALPNLQVLPYIKYNDFVRQGITLQPDGTPGSSQTIVSDTIKLNQIPAHILLFARRSRGTTTFATADSFANISAVSLLWNNESNLLTSATEQQLYQISKRNGLNLTYPQWNKYRGSVFKCQFGLDVGLIQGLSPGVMGQFTLQATVTFNNKNTVPVEYEFYLTTLLVGSAELTENSLALNLGNLTVEAVENAEYGPQVSHSDAMTSGGGSFFTSMKHFLNKLSRGVQVVGKLGQAVAPGIGMINPAIGAAVGVGSSIARDVGNIGRNATGGGLAGGAMAGGRMGRRHMLGRQYY